MLFKSKKRKPSEDAGADLGAPASPNPGALQCSDDACAGHAPLAENATAAEADTAQRQALAARSRFAGLGEIVGVLMNAPGFKSMPLSEVQKLVMPAVVTGQFRVGQAPLERNGPPVPVAVALWASVSEEVDGRLAQDQDAVLGTHEWKSGSIPWLVAAAGDPRVLTQMLEHIQTSVLHGQKLKMRTKDSAGKIAIGAAATAAGNGLAR
jgi:hemolysin-activating ACP:hemolysin acyltransferase